MDSSPTAKRMDLGQGGFVCIALATRLLMDMVKTAQNTSEKGCK